MEKVIESLTSIPKALTGKTDDDFLDRLSSHYTTFMLIVFAIVVTVQTYVGNVITCWVPKHVTDSQTKYVNSYCWVKNTYYVPMEERLPMTNEPREHVIPYYQWVPFILLGEALFFYLPSVFWHGLNQQGGVDCDDILALSHKLIGVDNEKKDEKTGLTQRQKMVNMLSNQMHRFLISRLKRQRAGMRCSLRNLVKMICAPCSRRFGAYLVLLFLISKVLYFLNIIAQLFALNAFLATQYNLYGFELFKYLSSDDDWTESPGVAFPRVTYCDFGIRRLANLHPYTVQCTLPINMFTEKIYMFLWFWFVFLAIMTPLGFIVWLMRALCSSDREKFVRNHLGRLNHEDEERLSDFVGNYLAQDGVFILRLIAHNTNAIVVTEITKSLFAMYKKVMKPKEPATPDDGSLDSSLIKPPLDDASPTLPAY